jgi:hypothetical protein
MRVAAYTNTAAHDGQQHCYKGTFGSHDSVLRSIVGWLISAACPTLRKPAPGFHTDALLFRLLVAPCLVRDLLLFAKHLFVAARTVWHGLQPS